MRSELRILQVVWTLSAGGAEGFAANLSIALRKAGAEVKVFLLAGVRDERGQLLCDRVRKAGIEIRGTEVRTRKEVLSNVKHFSRLVRLIRDWKPQIVQANQPAVVPACGAARLLIPKNGTRYVQRLASTKSIYYKSKFKGQILDRVFAQTIACSPSAAKAYIDFMKSRPAREVVTIQNGGALRDSIPGTEEKRNARRKLNIPENAFVVSHIGRMFCEDKSQNQLTSAPKAHDVLIKAFAKAFEDDPDCRLLLVGDGILRPQLEKMTQYLNIDNRVQFLGSLPEPWPALVAADIFCFPSRYEGLPNVLPEAASCGLPILASNISSVRYLDPGQAWRLEPVDNIRSFASAMQALRENIAHYVKAAKLVAPGFRERFSMDTCATEYLKAYEAVLKDQDQKRRFSLV